MPVSLFSCNNLHACDEFFLGEITGNWLGDIEPEEGEIEHLSGLIARALKNRLLLQDSLSVAVFLVWMGWLHYREGNYWDPVYQQLKLSAAQTRWQNVLGEVYLNAVGKYNLTVFQGKLRYISSILAHGYIPNRYLEIYFENVVLDIYIDREKANLQIKREEIAHLISSWCNDYAGYEKYQSKKTGLELAEDKLRNVKVVCQYKELLIEFRDLKNKLILKPEVRELLAYPVEWLDYLESEKANCEERYNYLCEQVEGQKKLKKLYKASLEEQKIKLRGLEGEINRVATQIFEYWDENLTALIRDLPSIEINVLANRKEYRDVSFHSLVVRASVIDLSQIPSDDIKNALAQLIVMCAHAYYNSQPHSGTIRQVLVFDEAHRVLNSEYILRLARECRAYGVGTILSSQYPSDFPLDVSASLATKIIHSNGRDMEMIKDIVKIIGCEGQEAEVSNLDRFQAYVDNRHYPHTMIRTMNYPLFLLWDYLQDRDVVSRDEISQIEGIDVSKLPAESLVRQIERLGLAEERDGQLYVL